MEIKRKRFNILSELFSFFVPTIRRRPFRFASSARFFFNFVTKVEKWRLPCPLDTFLVFLSRSFGISQCLFSLLAVIECIFINRRFTPLFYYKISVSTDFTTIKICSRITSYICKTVCISINAQRCCY